MPRGRRSWARPSSPATSAAAAENASVGSAGPLRIPKELKLPPGARILMGNQLGSHIAKNGGTLMMLKPNGSGGFVPVPSNILPQASISRAPLPPAAKAEDGAKDEVETEGSARKRTAG
eukprot:scaffold2141_cov282-Pinguiococcus_pyrenoidosus.AAC.36